MNNQLILEHFNHLNQIVPDYQDAVDHYVDVFGAEFLWKTTANPYAQACLSTLVGPLLSMSLLERLQLPSRLQIPRTHRFGGPRHRTFCRRLLHGGGLRWC